MGFDRGGSGLAFERSDLGLRGRAHSALGPWGEIL